MDSVNLKKLLKSVRSGKITTEAALKKLKHLPYENLCFAKVDHHRHLRQGIPEVVFAAGKTIEDVIAISHALYKKSRKVLITKASEEIFKRLEMKKAVFHPLSRAIAVNEGGRKRGTCTYSVCRHIGYPCCGRGCGDRVIFRKQG